MVSARRACRDGFNPHVNAHMKNNFKNTKVSKFPNQTPQPTHKHTRTNTHTHTRTNTHWQKTAHLRCFTAAPSISSRGGPGQPLREKVVRSFEACTRPPIELQPPTSTQPKRRGQRRGVPRSWGPLSTQNSKRAPGRSNPPSAGPMRGGPAPSPTPPSPSNRPGMGSWARSCL